MPSPIVTGLIAGGATVLSNIFSAREARRQERFQERMSNTAHRREVADLVGAGLHPMLSASRGADVPSGAMAQLESPAEAVVTALMAKRQEAEIDLLHAQAQKTRTESSRISTFVPGELHLQRLRIEAEGMSNDQLRNLMPLVLEKARGEIELISSSAARAKAATVLDEAAAAGARNLERFEREIGEAGPWVRFFFEVLRGIRGGGR